MQALREDGTAFQLPKAVASAVAQAELILPSAPSAHKRGAHAMGAMGADDDAAQGGEGGGRSKRAKRPMFKYSDLAENGGEEDIDLPEPGNLPGAEGGIGSAGWGLPPLASGPSADLDGGIAGLQRGRRGRGQGSSTGEAAGAPGARGGSSRAKNNSSSSLKSQGAAGGGGGGSKGSGSGWTLAAQQLIAMVLHATVSPDQTDSRVPPVREVECHP
jgi:hypothetical protein